MKKYGAISFVLFVLASFGSAMFISQASGGNATRHREVSHSLSRGSTSFTLYIPTPKKAVLYPESKQVSTSYSIVCVHDGVESREARSFDTPFTRNLLYKITPRQDECVLAVAAASEPGTGQIVVDISY